MLWQMRDISHEHINEFIGMCLEQDRVYIVTKYCQKGSLYVCIYSKKLCSWQVEDWIKFRMSEIKI
jgi:serine/threonine protein kinase